MIFFVFVLCVIAIVCYSLLINRIKGLPPGPPPLPLIGNFHQLDVDMDKNFVEWKKKYGRVFTIWMPEPMVVISDYKLLQEHIVKDGDKFCERLNRKVKMDILLGGEYGLLFNDNSMWKEQRRFALHSLRDIGFANATMQTTMIDYAQLVIAQWKIQGAGKKPVDLTKGIVVGVANVVWQIVFARTLAYDDPLTDQVRDLAREFVLTNGYLSLLALEFIPSLQYLDKFIGSPIKKFREVNRTLEELALKEIDLVRKEMNDDEEPKGFAESFLREMKKREDKGEDLGTFTRTQCVAACFDIVMAGFETTVSTLRFAFHHMIAHPEMQYKAQKEIDLHIGKRNITMEDQKSLHYCNAIIQEVQRLANIITVGFARRVTAPVTIEGYNIPVGTGVIPEFNIVHLDENEFDQPLLFWPERHMNENGEFVKDPRITPFSLGKRSCLGEGLARMELFIYFTTFIQHLTFSSVTRVPPALSTLVSFTRSPAPYEVIVESRE